MFKKFKLRFFGTEFGKNGQIVNNSSRIVDNRSLNEKMMDEMFLELFGED